MGDQVTQAVVGTLLHVPRKEFDWELPLGIGPICTQQMFVSTAGPSVDIAVECAVAALDDLQHKRGGAREWCVRRHGCFYRRRVLLDHRALVRRGSAVSGSARNGRRAFIRRRMRRAGTAIVGPGGTHLRLLQYPSAYEPVPPRPWALRSQEGCRLAPRGGEMQTAPGQDVGDTRVSDGAAVAILSGGQAVARRIAYFAAGGLHPERESRDRLDARETGQRDYHGHGPRAIPHRGHRGHGRQRTDGLGLGGAPRLRAARCAALVPRTPCLN